MPRPPATVVENAELAGERVLAAAGDPTGATWLLGTRTTLVLVGPDGVRRIPWEQVHRADWDRDAEALRVVEVATWGSPEPVHVVRVEEPGRLLELLRERVSASVVLQRFVPVAGKGNRLRGFRVVGRRAPSGRDIAWFVEYDDTVEPDHPGVLELVEAALRSARAEVGQVDTI